VRCFGTRAGYAGYGELLRAFLYALRREVLRNMLATQQKRREASFYTPFGVRCFGTVKGTVKKHDTYNEFLYALRREVLRNRGAGSHDARRSLRAVSIRPSA